MVEKITRMNSELTVGISQHITMLGSVQTLVVIVNKMMISRPEVEPLFSFYCFISISAAANLGLDEEEDISEQNHLEDKLEELIDGTSQKRYLKLPPTRML